MQLTHDFRRKKQVAEARSKLAKEAFTRLSRERYQLFVVEDELEYGIKPDFHSRICEEVARSLSALLFLGRKDFF
jgi:hypothetical protein